MVRIENTPWAGRRTSPTARQQRARYAKRSRELPARRAGTTSHAKVMRAAAFITFCRSRGMERVNSLMKGSSPSLAGRHTGARARPPGHEVVVDETFGC